MKKIVFLLAFVALAFCSEAQFARAYVYPTIAGDTLNSTGGADSTGRIITMTAGYNAASFAVNVTKLTGSAVTGKAYLLQSLDGVNFIVTDSAVYNINPLMSAKFKPNGITPSYNATAKFDKITTPSVYYMILATATGTVSQKVQFLYTARPTFSSKP